VRAFARLGDQKKQSIVVTHAFLAADASFIEACVLLERVAFCVCLARFQRVVTKLGIKQSIVTTRAIVAAVACLIQVARCLKPSLARVLCMHPLSWASNEALVKLRAFLAAAACFI
jgi:hypothetical protein